MTIRNTFNGVLVASVLLASHAHAQFVIRGRISDAGKKAVTSANVMLLRSGDSLLVKASISDNDGVYSFKNIAAGNYLVRIDMVGYHPAFSEPLVTGRDNADVTVAPIVITEAAADLGAVTVLAKKPLLEQKIDRLIINVASSITSAGNTALEILERSPGVMVDRQNNAISILGKDGVHIMINGKQSYMPVSAVVQMLDGMSAGNIEKIELITTPPASLDAEGKAGYINIVLKQNDNVGTNGSFSGTIGYGKGLVSQATLNFNHREGKINLYGDLSYATVRSEFPGNLYSRITNDANVYETFTTVARVDTTRNHNVRLGMDYQLTRRTILGVLFTANGRWYRQSEHNSDSFRLNNSLDTLVTTSNSELNDWEDYGINLNLQHNFKNEDKLSFNATYLYYNNNQPVDYYSRYFDKNGNFIYDESIKNGKVTPLHFWVGSVDYSRKLSEKIGVEAGVKGTIADFKNTITFLRWDQGSWVQDNSLSAIYTLNENYSAAYASMNFAASKKTSIKAGLRYEYINSNLSTEDVKNIVDRHYGTLFPTLFISHKLDENNSINLSYSRRITRPTFNDLAPFAYYVNRDVSLSGNPGLQPAISDAINVGYSFKKMFLSISYTNEDGSITSFQPTVDSVSRKTLYTPENLQSLQNLSVLLSVPVKVANWWSMQYNVTGIWQRVNTVYNQASIKLEQANVLINLTQTFTLPKQYSIELSGFYQSPALDGIAQYKAVGTLDLGCRKKFGSRDALNFNITNMLNSMDFQFHTDMPDQNLVSSAHLRFSWRTYKLTWSHSFGKDKLKTTRDRTTGAEDEKGRVHY